MNITILGAGAIGSLLANYLGYAGHKINLWMHNTELTTLSIAIDDQPPLKYSVNNEHALQHADMVIVAVKAWQVKRALTPLIKRLSTDTILLFIHNGMGAVDEIITDIENHPILLATTTHGAFKKNKHNVLHTGRGVTRIGGYNASGKQCSFIQAVLQHALPQVEWCQNIQLALWRKLAINCAINPLTAIEQCQNGALADKKYQDILSRIVLESTLVMAAENIHVTDDDLIDDVYHVIKTTSSNYSSMHQDRLNQRPTEIDYITGYLCKMAKRHQLDVKTNLALYNKMKQLENEWKIQ